MDTSESKTQLAGRKHELEKDYSATDGMSSPCQFWLGFAIIVVKHVNSCIQCPCGRDARSYFASTTFNNATGEGIGKVLGRI